MKSWKTTLIGALGAAAQVVYPLIVNGKVTPQEMLQAAGIAVLGYFSKDFNVSGTTTPPIQTPVQPTEEIKK